MKDTPQPGSSIVASVAVDRSGDVYFASSYNHLFSDDASTDGKFAVYKYSPGGVIVWQFLSSYVLHSTPVIDEENRLLYFGGNDGRLISLSLTTGEPVGCFTVGDAVSASPVGRRELALNFYE